MGVLVATDAASPAESASIYQIVALPPGTRLGPYEIAAQIGEGGMGEVYQATDTNLKRSVAIKVLPESVAGDAERLAIPTRSRSPRRAESSKHRTTP